MSERLILVDGATGYLGNHLVARLVEEGYRVRCLCRPRASASDLEFLKSYDCEIELLDFENIDDQAATRVFDNVQCMVHLIGSIAPKKGESFSSLHRDITQALVSHGKKQGLTKVVHLTALGSSATAPSKYHQSKWLAEEVVRQSGINYTILRPSLIYGRTVGNRDSKLVARLFSFINNRPFVPLINGGQNKIEPIFVGDVVEAIVAAIKSTEVSSTVELGGGQVMKMRDFVKELAGLVKKEVKILPLVPGIASTLAKVMERIQEVPVLSEDQVVLSLTDNVCQSNGFQSLTHLLPTPLDQALSTYKDTYIQSL